MTVFNHIKKLSLKVSRFGLFIPLSNIIIVYCNKFLPKKFISYIFQRRNQHIEKKLLKIVPLTIKETIPIKPQGKAPLWFFWLQGEKNMPLIPKLCLKYLRKNANGHPINIITEENIFSFADIPQYIIDLHKRGRITTTHLSDILRLALLSQRGGFWVDSTLLILKPIPEEVFSNEFFSIKNKEWGYFASHCRWTGFCMASWPSSRITATAYNMLIRYWRSTDVIIDYFILDYILDILYNLDETCHQMISALNFSNPGMNKLNQLLCQEFNQDTFNDIIADTYIFKLSWKSYTADELNSNTKNYYNYLLKAINS